MQGCALTYYLMKKLSLIFLTPAESEKHLVELVYDVKAENCLATTAAPVR